MMNVHYDFYENPCAPHQRKRRRLHARVVGGHTAGMEDMMRHLRVHGTLSESAILYALQELNLYIVERLSEGRRVHVEGLGYFSISLSCPETRNESDHHAQSIKLKTVNFRPEKELVKEVGNRISFVRAKRKTKSQLWTLDELRGWLRAYLAEHTFVSVRDVSWKCGLTRGTAYNRVHKLLDEGFLVNKGTSRSPIFMLAEGNN